MTVQPSQELYLVPQSQHGGSPQPSQPPFTLPSPQPAQLSSSSVRPVTPLEWIIESRPQPSDALPLTPSPRPAALREYLAIPTFEHLRSSAHTATSPSPSLHLKNMVESASSGAATGAGFAIYHYGLSRRIVSGGFTFGLFAVLGQLGFNELNLARIRYVERNERASSQATTRLESEPRKPALYQRVTESFFSVAPIRRVSNEEYSETIKDKISKTQNELAVVNGQVHDIEERLQELRAVREQHERQV